MRFFIGLISGAALLALGATAAQAAPDPAVLHVQRHLATHGYYHGPLDGIVGRLTRAAILAFERANGYPVTGNPAHLAPRIGYNPPGPAGGPGAGPVVVNPPGPAGGPGAGPGAGPANPPGPAGGPGAGPRR